MATRGASSRKTFARIATTCSPVNARCPVKEHSEQHAPEREDVGARIDIGRTDGLLRRHVAHRADDRTGARQHARAQRVSRDTEVEELEVRGVAVDEEEVRRLDVAMDDAAPVRDRESLGDAASDRERLAHARRSAREAVRQVLTLQPLHREKPLATAELAVCEVTHDRGMLQLGEDLRFLHEAVVLATRAVERLDRDRHTGGAIGREVDGAHATLAGEPLDHEAVSHDIAAYERPVGHTGGRFRRGLSDVRPGGHGVGEPDLVVHHRARSSREQLRLASARRLMPVGHADPLRPYRRPRRARRRAATR